MAVSRIILALLSLALLLGGAPARAARIDVDERIAQIPAFITGVSTCGHWHDEHGNYLFRILHAGFFQGNSLLYVQWLREGGAAPELLHSVSIAEFNADDHIELIFAQPRCIATRHGIRLNIVAESGHDLKKHHFRLEVSREPGKYRLREIGRR